MLKPFPPSLHTRSGLTLTELLVGLAIVAALAMLLFGPASRVRQHARSAECANRLRQVGVLFHSYAADHNGLIKLFRDGSAGGPNRWYNLLRTHARFTESEAMRQFGCPSMDESRVNDWMCYGMRIGGAPGEIKRDTPESPRLYNLNIRSVSEPGKFFLAGDSVLFGDGRQSFRVQLGGLYNATAGLHLRHLGKANLLYLDGHVSPASPGDLAQLGFTEAVDAESRKVPLP